MRGYIILFATLLACGFLMGGCTCAKVKGAEPPGEKLEMPKEKGAKDELAKEKEKLVGRWDNPVTDQAYIRFKEDGTFKDVALLANREGTYRVLEKGVIEIKTPGVLYGTNVGEIKYKLIDDDTLEILGVKYKRVK
jgi:hypothetical protein